MSVRCFPRLRHTALIALLACAFAHAGDAEDIQVLLRGKQFAQVLDKADKSLAKNPKDAQIRFMRGLALTELGRTDEAIKAFVSLSEDYPQLPEPYNNLAVLYAQQNQLDKSRAALQMAIQTNPSYAIAHENLGDLYARLASQAYSKALQLENNNNVQTKLKLVSELFSQNGTLPRIAQAPATKPGKTTPPAPTVAPLPTLPPVATPVPTAKAAPTPKPLPTLAPAPTPAPVATPVPAKTETAKGGHDAARQQIIAAIDGWATAWSNKNVNGYLGAYSRQFKAPGGQKFDAWAKDRRERISAPKSIDVEVSDVKIDFVDDDTVKVRFRQSYKSERLSTSTGKTLIMQKSGNRWLIVEERAGA
ncbi:Tetratricopeptide repeat-containing protein [Andreprevotia lacus DSM 23236]|jgi:tetratricopeptide (TPR) repeat protein|uniref:Tetratricopeptide repeat-containing protein n=1 Tax=Andreprevotia lacus DSM 23236 TaxID=1121001 RepID=A0A1W1WYZ5_9NEIS|nr:nuclear transport factor 2 family protein [Andreprevotia lacus]SMC16942.1 Tetratricopeptide repeat-containing protein [Andreprevotia lacus DSM 23236]